MALAATPPHILLSLATGTARDLQWLHVVVVPFASQDSSAGCPLMYLVFLVRWEENTESMVEIRILGRQ